MIFNKKLKERIKELEKYVVRLKESEKYFNDLNTKNVLECANKIEKLEKENVKIHKSNTNLGQKNKKIESLCNLRGEQITNLSQDIYNKDILILNLKKYNKNLKSANTRLTNKLKEYEGKTIRNILDEELDEVIKDAMKNGFKKDPNAKEITIVGLHSEGQEYHIPNTLIDIDDNGVETHTLPFIVTDNDKKRVEETKKQLKNKVGKPRKKDK